MYYKKNTKKRKVTYIGHRHVEDLAQVARKLRDEKETAPAVAEARHGDGPDFGRAEDAPPGHEGLLLGGT